MTNHLVRILAISLYVFWVILSETDPKIEEDKAREYTHSIISRVQQRVYVIKPEDSNRLVDCTDEVSRGGPIGHYPFMKFYGGQLDPLNGFIESNSWPVYIHARGLERILPKSLVIIGFRGDTAGIHRSLITPKLYGIYDTFENSVLYMPGSYIKLENGKYQSVCHKRFYRSDRIYIGDKWPSMIAGGSWKIYSDVLGEHSHIFMFSYSNGGLARDEYIKTNPLYPESISITNSQDFIEYARLTKFADPRVERIEGMMDVESVFAGPALLDLGKYLLEEVNQDQTKFYYSACRIDSFSAAPHVSLIRALSLIGYELPSGVIRYQNHLRNIVMDIIPKAGTYSYGAIDLSTQTTYLPDNRSRPKYETDHFKILGYATSEFKKLAQERGLLK